MFHSEGRPVVVLRLRIQNHNLWRVYVRHCDLVCGVIVTHPQELEMAKSKYFLHFGSCPLKNTCIMVELKATFCTVF